MRKLIAVAGTLALAASLAGQEGRFSEQIDVNLVLIDAIVTDSSGNQILGLQPGDFIVTEDGQPQQIEALDYFTNRKLLDRREGSAPFKVEQVREERYFVFFFDKPPDTQMWNELTLARNAAQDFIDKEMLPGDRVAIAGHDVRLKVYSDFTADKQQLRRALNEVTRFGKGLQKPPSQPAEASILREINFNRMISRTGTVYQALHALGDALRPIRARKNLILFSAGIHEPGEEVRDGVVLNTSRYYEPMVNALNRANVAVYAINMMRNAPEVPAIHQTLSRVADDTSGEYFRTAVSYAPFLERIDKSNAGYYLITYRTRRADGAKGFQKVDVAVKNPEFRVQARRGYGYGS
jgi:VWFA-related protein